MSWCVTVEKITCKDCWKWKTRDKYYSLANVYLLQPCKECRKKYWKNRYDKGIWFYSDKKNNLKNNKK